MDPPAHETTYPPGTPAPVRGPVERPCPAVAPDCCGPRALFGWSPPPLPADTALKRRGGAPLPPSRVRLGVFFAGVVVLLDVGGGLPQRLGPGGGGPGGPAGGGWGGGGLL